MKRKPIIHKKVDSRIFTTTAKKSKQINIDPGPMRGGIRL